MKFSDIGKGDDVQPPQSASSEEPRKPAAAPEPPVPERRKPAPAKLSFSRLTPPGPGAEPPENKLVQPPPAPADKAAPSARDPFPTEEKALQAPAKKQPLTYAALQAQRAEASKIYGQAIRVVQAIYSSVENYQLEVSPLLEQACSDMLQALAADNQALVAMTARSTANNYLYAHAVNLTILSLYIAGNFQWEDGPMRLLGIAALLHDMGMTKYVGLVQEPRTLSEAEIREVRLHPMESERLLGHLKDIEESTRLSIAQISGQVHERRGGEGYPKGLRRDEDIHLAAQVIGLCDAYEAMTHPRNWREPMIPHDAVKLILKQCAQQFNSKLIKVFMERMSIFPLGSYVRLSSGEIGGVVQVHPHLPTRPTIEVKIRADGRRQEKPLLIDLSERPMVHAERAVDETKLALDDKKLILQLQASRWWTD